MSVLSFGSRGVRRMVGMAAVAVAIALGTPAHAQFSGGSLGFNDQYTPKYTKRDMRFFVEGLTLDDAQRFIFETIIEEHGVDIEESFDAARKEMTEISQQMAELGPDEIMKRILIPMQNWLKHRTQLYKQVDSDLQTMLTEEQLELWPDMERKLRRINTLRTKGRFSMEGVDLIMHLDQMNLEPPVQEAIESTAMEYKLRIDEALQRRNDGIRALQIEELASMTGNDDDARLDIVRKQIELRLAVRDVNVQYLSLLAASLPAELGNELVDLVNRQAFPRIFRRSHVKIMFDRVLALETLDSETRAAVESLHTEYQSEMARTNEALIALTMEGEPDQALERAKRRIGQVRGERPADPIREKLRERDQMEQRYLERLRELLTPEQAEQVPGLIRNRKPGMPEIGGASKGITTDRGRSQRDRQRDLTNKDD